MNYRSFIPVLVITSIATFLSNMSAGVVNVPLAALTNIFHGNAFWLVTIVLSYVVPYAVVMPVIGKLGDAYGQKRVFLWGLGLYATTSAVAGFAPTLPWLVGLRFLQGLGGGVILVSIVFIGAQLREGKGLALGIWRAALLTGTVGGPVIGGYVYSALGWPALFWLGAPIAAALWIWAIFSLEEIPPKTQRFDFVGSASFLVAATALVVALSAYGMETMQPGISAQIGSLMRQMAYMLLGIFAVGTIVLVLNQKMERRPLFDLSLYRVRPFVLGNLGTWIVCIGMFSAMMFVPLGLQYLAGYTALQASNALLPLAVTAIIVGVWGGRLTDSLGIVAPWAAGFAIMAAGFAALASIGWHSSPWIFAVIMTVLGVGMALPLAPTAVAALTTVPAENAGEAAGLFNFAHNLGRAMSVGLLGALLIVNDPSRYLLIFVVSAIVMAIGGALALGLVRRVAATPAATEV